jgi:formylglycine-generating enzyme required for sulfatase activity
VDELLSLYLELATFQIATYPVTVAEYTCFLITGHKQPPAWDAQRTRLDHPVTYITWHDAQAYTAWLARIRGEPWRLPTEAQREKAAGWDDASHSARRYPWGDTFDELRCNTRETAFGGTSPIGSFPNGASPSGALDMAGNVWEWTRSVFDSYPYNPEDGREQVDMPGNRVMRGGSWADSGWFARVTFRNFDVFVPGAVLNSGGFRAACETTSARSDVS